MREQSREIAAKVRKRVNDEKERQRGQYEEIKEKEMQTWKATTTTIDANQEAQREIAANRLYRERQEEFDLMAAQRGRDALRKVVNERPKPIKRATRSKSIEVQTDFSSLVDVPGCVLPPESLDHDHHNIPLISDRSLDILEKSKQFVSDAQRRLDDLSARLVGCATSSAGQSSSSCNNQCKPIQSKSADVSPVKQPSTVRTNKVTELRTVRNRQVANQRTTAIRPTKPPRKVISSCPSSIPPPQPPQMDGAQSSSSVLCYDHPNRFTKKYDIPKSIIVKNLGDHRDEDDAVTNAMNETLTQLEQDQLKEKRSKELKQKESIRELEALEKSQVRRDYEMLAKTLEEVRKADIKSTNNSFNSTVDGQKSEVRQQESRKPIEVAFEKIVHQPIRISCPRVDGKAQMELNVGLGEDGVESLAEYSSTDSGKTLILDQLSQRAHERPQGHQARNPPKEVVIVTKNNASNVKVLSAGQEGINEPLKIIIQVEDGRGAERRERASNKENGKWGIYLF